MMIISPKLLIKWGNQAKPSTIRINHAAKPLL